jgi:FAD/FMN-containing dehydrogenase
MTIDNLQQATLVTANGEIITVSEDSHPDLFWAIRGAGPNFGVVTEFVYRLHDQSKMVFAGPLIYPPTMINQVVDAMGAIIEKGDPDTALLLVTISSTPPPPRGTGGPGLVAFVFHNGEEAEGIKRIQSLIYLGECLT